MKPENIVLFDMDGTLCNYNKALIESLEKLRSPDEDIITTLPRDSVPIYLMARMDIIQSKAS